MDMTLTEFVGLNALVFFSGLCIGVLWAIKYLDYKDRQNESNSNTSQ